MVGFIHWLKQKYDRGSASQKVPPLPTLPDIRPRASSLGPEDGPPRAAPNATKESSLFRRLPREIRRQILIDAFGNQTVHLDLRLVRPLITRHKSDSSHRHSSSSSSASMTRRGPRWHANAPTHADRVPYGAPEWEWWGSVCHRTTCPNPFSRAPGAEMPWSMSHRDACRPPMTSVRTTENACCEYYPGAWPDKCRIGAMGWLLSCRQAYVEGVEVLYGTNTVHMAGTHLVRWLPGLVLPRGRAAITSVELVWYVRGMAAAHEPGPAAATAPPPPVIRNDTDLREFNTFSPGSDMAGYTSLCGALPDVLPGVRHISLSLCGLMPLSSRLLDFEAGLADAERVLRPIDGLVRRLGPRLKDCRVALPSRYYRVVQMAARGVDIEWLMGPWGGGNGKPEAVWRELPEEGEEKQGHEEQEQEAGAAGVPAEERRRYWEGRHGRGYWILHGERDLPRPMLSEV